MPQFHVVWEIDVDAETPYEAAQMAQYYQRLPDTTATVFEVFPYSEEGDLDSITIDLLEKNAATEGA